MNNKKYNITGTVPKSNRTIVETESESISLAHNKKSYMIAHFPDLVQTLL